MILTFMRPLVVFFASPSRACFKNWKLQAAEISWSWNWRYE